MEQRVADNNVRVHATTPDCGLHAARHACSFDYEQENEQRGEAMGHGCITHAHEPPTRVTGMTMENDHEAWSERETLHQ